MLQIETGGGPTVAIILTAPVVFSDVLAALASLVVAGNPVASVNDVQPTQISVDIDGDVFPDDPWSWASDGGAADPPLNLPASGFVQFA